MRYLKYGLIVLSVIGIVIFILYEMGVFLDDNDTLVEEHIKKQEETKEEIRKGRQTNESDEKKGITKEELLELMLDSTLNFDNAQGEYIYSEAIEQSDPNDGSIQNAVTYVIDRKNVMSKHHSINKYYGIDTFHINDSLCYLYVDNHEKEYRYIPHSSVEYDSTTIKEYSIDERIHERILADIDGANLLNANDVISSGLMNYLKNLGDWDFEETEFMDFSSYLIKGARHGIETDSQFSMIVEKNTGIILDFQENDKEGNELASLQTTKLEIDVEEIEADVFEVDLTGYKEGEIPSTVPEEYLPDELKDVDICKP